MDSDFDIKFEPEEPVSRPVVSPGFLEAFGLESAGEPDPVESFSLDADEEPVALSSFPEDLDFPKVVAEPTRGLALSISVTRGGAVPASGIPVIDVPAPDAADEIPVPAVDEMSVPEVEAFSEWVAEAPAPEVQAAPEEIAPVVDDAGDVVQLECPGCGGGLVLRRQHLGIEGLCVWCHTPIVAAESARDGQVRVYPIFGGPEGPKKPVAEEKPAPVIAPDPEPPVVEPVIEPVIEPVSEVPVPEPAVEVPAPAAVVEDPPLPSGPLDLESLYAVGGFVEPEAAKPAVVEPVVEKVSTIGFVMPKPEPSPAPAVAPAPPAAAEEPALGFGNFLKTGSAASEPVDSPATGFGGPTPWGPPTLPAETPVPSRPSPQPASTAFTGFGVEEKPEDDGPSPFSGAVPGPMPSAFAEPMASSPDPGAPTSINGFDIPAVAVNRAFSVGSSEDDAPAAISFPGSVSNDSGFGFAAPAPAEAPSGLFDSPTPPPVLPWDVVPEVSDEAPGGFLDAPPAPAPVLPVPATGGGDPLFSHFAPAESVSGDSLFLTEPEREMVPESSVPAAEAPAILPVPIVTSQPLGSRPKPKVRKSFLVLMVVLLGFACGAALASYVLPVDQYVKQGRAYMESKFGTVPTAVAPQNNSPAQP